ncbi:MAG TPA: hypothetical protein VHD36_09580 [Pirellulales bacterium]|nr:hypothetical protein [Pirellulales bacterium]
MKENPVSEVADRATNGPSELQARALEVLQNSLANPSPYVRLHAAESLILFGFTDTVLPIYERALERDGDIPGQRICIWRVLARAKPTAAGRAQHVDRLCAICLSPHSPDAASAAESLAKLKYRVDAAHRSQYEGAMERLPTAARPHGRWLLAMSGDRQDLERLADLLDNPDPNIRGVAAYALRHLREDLPPRIIKRIAAAAIAEASPSSRKYLVSAAFVTGSARENVSAFKSALLDYLRSGRNDEKYESATALGINGTAADLDTLVQLLHDADADVQVAASTAVLHILIRTGQSALPVARHAVA